MASKTSKVTKTRPAKTTKPRVRATPRHRSFRVTKKKLKQVQPIPGSWLLLKSTTAIIKNNKKLFFGISFINALLSFIFVQGLGSAFGIVELKEQFNEVLGDGAQSDTTIALFGTLISSAGSNAGAASGAYQLFLLLITLLAIIWAVRQVQAGYKPTIRDSYYKGMYPMIPFVLVLFVIALQFIPMMVGSVIYTTVVQNSLAATAVEQVLFLMIFILLTMLTLYMLVSSLFALYIVTLPDMTPIKALRSARELVLHRRLGIVWRIVLLPIVLFLLTALIFIPLLIVAAPIVEPLFLLMTGFTIVISNTYMYLLYRSLL